MADFNIQPVATQIKPMQGMSLAEMINLGRGVQQFQQAEEKLPLELEYYRSQLAVQKETEEAQKQAKIQEARRVTAEAGRSETEEKVSASTAQDRINKAGNEAKLAQTQADAANLKLAGEKLDAITNRATALYNDPMVAQAAKDPTYARKNRFLLAAKIESYVNEQGRMLGMSDEEVRKHGDIYTTEALNNPSGVQKFLGDKLLAQQDAANRIAALQGKEVTFQYGTGTRVIRTPFNAPQTIVGETKQGQLPELREDPFTGEIKFFGGSAGGMLEPKGAPPPAAPKSAVAAKPSTAVTQKPPAEKISTPSDTAIDTKPRPIEPAPGENPAAYKQRVERIGKYPSVANTALNAANVDSIPNMENINNRVLNLLEKKNLDIGPLAKAIADKTGGIGLSPDQQEVIKYLEQRIRQQAARTNQDQDSQRSAFGNFGTSKEALRDIIYTDKGTLAAQRMFYEGIKKYQGNPNKPNLAAMSEFENKFTDLAQPDVTYLIGIIGNKSANQLTKSDLMQMNKHFGPKSDEAINKLFEQRDALKKLVQGAK